MSYVSTPDFRALINVLVDELVAANSSDLPIVICGNMSDLDEQDREVKCDSIQWNEELRHVEYYDISTMTDLNFESPFLWMMRQILNDADLVCCAQDSRTNLMGLKLTPSSFLL